MSLSRVDVNRDENIEAARCDEMRVGPFHEFLPYIPIHISIDASVIVGKMDKNELIMGCLRNTSLLHNKVELQYEW